MAEAYKRLGAIASTGTITTADVLYTAPASTTGVVSTIVICNQTASTQTYRICVNTSTAFASAGYLMYGCSVGANDSAFLSLGLTLAAGSSLLCSGTSASVSFSAFGAEIT